MFQGFIRYLQYKYRVILFVLSTNYILSLIFLEIGMIFLDLYCFGQTFGILRMIFIYCAHFIQMNIRLKNYLFSDFKIGIFLLFRN